VGIFDGGDPLRNGTSGGNPRRLQHAIFDVDSVILAFILYFADAVTAPRSRFRYLQKDDMSWDSKEL
jgi:hypothetical protein